jgi:hypothetical protein
VLHNNTVRKKNNTMKTILLTITFVFSSLLIASAESRIIYGMQIPLTAGISVSINLKGSRVSADINDSTAKVSYDYAGRIDKIGDIKISYDYESRVSKINNLEIEYDYAGRLSRIGESKISYDYADRVSSIGESRITYDYAGRLTGISSHLPNGLHISTQALTE